jgi:hypothetical protein
MMISIFKAYVNGIDDVWKNKKLLFLIYGIQVIIAYLMTIPVSDMLGKAFSNSTMGERILQQFDLTAFTTMLRHYGKGIDFIGFIITFGIIYLIVSTFLAGGIIWLFVIKSKFSIGEFFNRCVQYFSRFFRLFLVSLLYFIAAVIIFIIIGKLFSLLTKNSITEVLPVTLWVVKVLFLIIMVSVINMIFDYAKIITINNDNHKMFSTSFESIKFILMNYIKSSGLYGLYFLTGIILLVIYLVIENAFTVQSFLGVILFFILTQVYIFLRQWLRLSFFSGQTIYYQHTITAVPGMLNKEMLEMAVENYEKRVQQERKDEENK